MGFNHIGLTFAPGDIFLVVLSFKELAVCTPEATQIPFQVQPRRGSKRKGVVVPFFRGSTIPSQFFLSRPGALKSAAAIYQCSA